MWLRFLLIRFGAAGICAGLCTANGTGLTNVAAGQTQVDQIFQIVFGVIGALSVIIILIAGVQFVTSQGDPQAASKARQTIIYAVIGLIVALLAEVIVTFVINRL